MPQIQMTAPPIETQQTYESRRKEPYYPSEGEERTAADLRNRVKSSDSELYELHGIWYQISLFKHGLQHTIFNYVDGSPYYQTDAPDGQVRSVYNVMQAVQNQTAAYFMDSPPRHTARALTEDGEDVEKSKAASQVLKYWERHSKIRSKRAEIANWVTTLGNGCLFVGWDPTLGPKWSGWTEEGWKEVPLGDWVCEVVPPYQVIHDPEAKTPYDSQWVMRRRRISRDWVVQHFPDKEPFVADMGGEAELGQTYEMAWLTLSTRHGFSSRSEKHMPDGRNQVYIYELWEKPSPYHPQGRYIIMTSDEVILHMGPNPYEERLPIVHFRFIPVEGSFWARTTMLDLMYLQMEINRRESQKSEHCNLLGNPPMFHWEGDGIDEDNVTNLIGQVLSLSFETYPAQPFFLRMPELSTTVREMVPEAMKFIDFISGNYGPSRGEVYSQIKSGVQQMMIEEADAKNMGPYMSEWEQSWEEAYNLALFCFRKYSPAARKMQVLGDNNAWRLRYLSGQDVSDDTDIEIVPGSTFPTSGATTFTKMLALLQAGAINMMEPSDSQRFWEALNMNDMVRVVADKTVDREKAQRNIDRIKQGSRPMYDPIGDDPQIHLDVLNSWMKTFDFEQADQLVKTLALFYRQQILMPLQQAMRMPVAEGFGMYGGGDEGQPAGATPIPSNTMPSQVGEAGGQNGEAGVPGAGMAFRPGGLAIG